MLTYGVSQGALGGSIDIPPGGDGRAELEMARLTLGRKVCLARLGEKLSVDFS